MVLHHAEPALQRYSSGQHTREGPERRAIVACEDQEVVAAAALALGLEAQFAFIVAHHRGEIRREAHRRSLRRTAGEPDGALAPAGRVIDPADEVPGDGEPVGALADPGGPPPLGLTRVVASGIVDHGERPN